MHSITSWNFAQSPNYSTNIDKQYPYSEVPFIGNYKLVKLPTSEELLEHVDYWGEGRIVTVEGLSSGYPDCYNVNHHYQLVSNGPDTDKKIPNRIPTVSYTNCNTSSYIKDNSVKIVTLMGAPINKSCAIDITRMINDEVGLVVVFGFNSDSADIMNLEEELKKKNLHLCHGFKLLEKVKALSLFKEHESRAYSNLTELGNELQRNVTRQKYDDAVNITKTLFENTNGNKGTEIITKLLEDGNKYFMTYAFKLWNGGSKDIIMKHLPICFSLILNGDQVKFINKQNMWAIKLDVDNTEKLVFADEDITSRNKLWKLVPIWEEDNVYFKILNVENETYSLMLDSNNEKANDRAAKGVKLEVAIGKESQWIIEPIKYVDDVVFFIINRQFNQGLMLGEATDSPERKQLLIYNGSVYGDPEKFGWYIAPLH